MKPALAGLLLIAAFVASGCAPMETRTSMHERGAPPAPTFSFSVDPQFNFLSDRQVGVISDDSFGYDMFSSGGSYYLYSGGYWYSARAARGPFTSVDETRVPRGVFTVDDTQYHWRSHPSGWRGGQPHADGNNGHGGGNGNNDH